MEPFPVVEQLDVPENSLPHVFDVLEVTPVGHRKSLRDLYFCVSVMCKQICPRLSTCYKLLLEAGEEAFRAGVVVGTPRCAHRGSYPVLREHRAVAHATVLHARSEWKMSPS